MNINKIIKRLQNELNKSSETGHTPDKTERGMA